MKHKILSLLTLLVVCVTGAWADDPTPGNADSKYLDIANYSTIVSTYSPGTGLSYKYYDAENGVLTILASAVTANGTKQNWVTSNNGSTSSKTWNLEDVQNSTYFKGSTGFKTSSNVPAVSIKGTQSTPRNYSFRITNCTKVQALINSSNTSRTVTMTVYPVTGANYDSRGEALGSASDNSNAVKVIEVSGLTEGTVYEVFITSNSSSESLLYELAFFTPVDTRSNVTLSFPNSTESATLGSSFSAPTLTVSPAAAASAVSYSSSNTSIAEVNASTGAITLKAAGSVTITAAISGNATYKDASASYTLEVIDPTAPYMSVSPASIELNANGNTPNPSATFTITGSNLTDGNYDISVPSIVGLSVYPTSVTVSDGSLSQEVTVTYAPSVDAASSSSSITLTINEIEASVTVDYSATLSVYAQETISSATTWDFVNGIDHEKSSDVRETQSSAKVYANTSIAFEESFPKTSLTYSTAGNYYAYRNANKCSQGATLSFKTSVPGLVTVLFSHNGSGSQYAKVNGTTGSLESTNGGNQGATAISESFYVKAGTVTLTGSEPNQIRFFKIEFTPCVAVTISAAGWATYCSPYALDFSENIENLEDAFIITGGADGVVAKESVKGESVPANTGLLLKGVGECVIPVVASSETSVSDNILEGVIASTEIVAEEGWVLMASPKVGFYQNARAFTVGANTAYIPVSKLPVPGDGAPARFLLEDEENNATAIEAVEANESAVKFFENGNLYIMRNGIVYDAVGRVIR